MGGYVFSLWQANDVPMTQWALNLIQQTEWSEGRHVCHLCGARVAHALDTHTHKKTKKKNKKQKKTPSHTPVPFPPLRSARFYTPKTLRLKGKMSKFDVKTSIKFGEKEKMPGFRFQWGHTHAGGRTLWKACFWFLPSMGFSSLPSENPF